MTLLNYNAKVPLLKPEDNSSSLSVFIFAHNMDYQSIIFWFKQISETHLLMDKEKIREEE